ncbi:MAG: DUF4189 domain-containing protein [Variovorax sp.]
MRCALALLVLCGGLAGIVAPPAGAASGQGPSWGAIASKDHWYGYSSNYATRAAAERSALSQCDRLARRPGTCAVRTVFDRSCSALAEGNYGEWGTAMAPTQAAANQEAASQCDAHLPAEPCKVVVSVCSLK